MASMFNVRLLVAVLLLCLAWTGEAKPKWKHNQMVDPTTLADGLIGYWNLDQNFTEHMDAFDLVPPHTHSLTGSPYILNSWPLSGVGKIGGCAEFNQADVNQRLSNPGATVFRMGGNDKTVALWFKLRSTDGVNNQSILATGFGYTLSVHAVTRQVSWITAGGTVTHTAPLSYDTWYLIAVVDKVASTTAYLTINGSVVSGAAQCINIAEEFRMGSLVNGFIDEFAIWDRALSFEELDAFYNNGAGITYTDIVPPPPVPGEECRAVECCEDDVFAYQAAPGSGASFNSECFPEAAITFTPQSGEVVIFPILVSIRSSTAGATIRYTIDGTDPDASSTLYTTPVDIFNQTTELRARAFVEGCPPGPVASALYQLFTYNSAFTYACDTPDFAGQWAVFAANGTNDYHWRLDVTFPSPTNITSFDVRLLDRDGYFKGQLWSTKEYPFNPCDAVSQAGFCIGPEFRAFPLVIKIGGVQQNSAYSNDYSADFGTFAAASHALDLYGDQGFAYASTDLFMVRMTFRYGEPYTRISRLVDVTCDALPPACPIPAAPTLSATCGGTDRIDVTFTCGVGTNFKIFRSTTEVGGYSEITSGVVGSNPQTYQDTTVSYGVQYYYYVSNQPAGCPDYKDSDVASAVMLSLPTVQISASPTTINPGDSSTISWNSQNIVGNVTLSAPIGVKPGNTPGSQSVSPVVTTIYTIDGSNTCASATQGTVTVTVNPSASCNAGSEPNLVEIVDYTDTFFNISACSLLAAGPPVWNGRFPRFGNCTYHLPQPNLSLNGKRLDGVTGIYFLTGPTRWQVDVVGNDAGIGIPLLIWRGTKLTGDTAVGIYNRTTGCSTTPATLSIVQV